MNFAQLHEALRLEILRRIKRGVLTGKLLAQQTGFKQAHISNFLRQRRLLSLNALDRLLLSQRLTVVDLLPGETALRGLPKDPLAVDRLTETVPLITQTAAIHDAHISAHEVLLELRLPAVALENVRERRTLSRADWQRWVAVRITAKQAEARRPVLSANALVVIDRHYNSLAAYRPGQPDLLAIAVGNIISIRYVTLDSSRLVLRPVSVLHEAELIDLAPGVSAWDLIVGRVHLTIQEM